MKIRPSYLTAGTWRCHRIWCRWVEQGRWFLFKPQKVSRKSPDQSLQIKKWEEYKIFWRIWNNAPKETEVWVQQGVLNIFHVQFQPSQHCQPFHLLCHWGLTRSTSGTGILCLLQSSCSSQLPGFAGKRLHQLHLGGFAHRNHMVICTTDSDSAISKATSSVVSSALTSAAQSGCSGTQQGTRDTSRENKDSEESGKTAWFMKSLLLPKEKPPFGCTAWHLGGQLTRRCHATDTRRFLGQELSHFSDGFCCSHTSVAVRNL